MCTRPETVWKKLNPNESGKYGITWNRKEANLDSEMVIPCGKCLECRKHHVNQWALRATLESYSYEESCFITLTYNDENLPNDDGREDGYKGGVTLKHKDFQDFMKRVRKLMDKSYNGKKLKYFMCGEYGGLNGRPHFHAIIFGHNFREQKIHEARKNFNVYRSDELETLWTKGFSTLGECHYGTCAYVAKYAAKRLGGDESHVNKTCKEIAHHYQDSNGQKRMEYLRASQGIGKEWCLENAESILSTDRIILRAFSHFTPKSFLRWLEKDYPERVQAIKDARFASAMARAQYQKRDIEYINKTTGEIRVIVGVNIKQPVDRQAFAVKEWKQLLEMGLTHLKPHLNPKYWKWS